jgi:RND family efflux transporter MFP subunit
MACRPVPPFRPQVTLVDFRFIVLGLEPGVPMTRSYRLDGRAAAVGAAVVLSLVLSTGCGGGPSQAGKRPPVGVEFTTVEPVPIERTTEYIATLKSRRSMTLQPMVEGLVTRIAVKSGDRVEVGDLVLEIDAGRQRAAVAALESLRAARQADLAYARREAERQKALFDAGAASAKDAEQAQTGLEIAEAQLNAVEEQLQEQKVELAYYRVSAPKDGIVGDVPVRVGDRVNTSTVLTTIDTSGALEIYIYVPVRSAGDLQRGLPVRVVDDDGGVLASTAIDFVSPQVDEATQTVLAKAPMPDSEGFRNEQQVRARVIWSEDPGLTVPVVAVSRVSGRIFAFVVEDGDDGPVARQRTLRLGPIVGNDYVVLDGLAPGDRLVVSGIQKIRDGAAIAPTPQSAEARG